MTPSKRTTPTDTTPPCGVGEHWYCRPGDVRTRYGDVALTVRCACSCHKEKARR